MFTLSQKHAGERLILKYEFIICIPPSLNLLFGENNQTFIDILGEVSGISLKDS